MIDKEKKHPPSKKVVLITPLKGAKKLPSKKAANVIQVT